jgi:hypothetical protein
MRGMKPRVEMLRDNFADYRFIVVRITTNDCSSG